MGGQSVGAVSVNDLIVSLLAKGLFRGAVAESGSSLGIAASPLAAPEQLGVKVQQQFDATWLIQLRALPTIDLLKGTTKASIPDGSQFTMVTLPLAPNVDGYTLRADASDPAGVLASPEPLLSGFNSDEYGLVVAQANRAEFEEMERESYGALADRFLTLYTHDTNAEAGGGKRAMPM